MPTTPPLRDQNGKILPHDHPEIGDADYVIRHIVPPNDLHTDPDTRRTRVSSGAYSESSDGGMSVDIQPWMHQEGIDDFHYLPDETQGATKIRVGELRKLGLKVGWDPDAGHKHHGAVWGITNTSIRKKVARLAVTLKKAEGET
jgi:hypothetical protein